MRAEYRMIIVAWVITILVMILVVGAYVLISSDTREDSRKESTAIQDNTERSKDNKAKLGAIDKKCAP